VKPKVSIVKESNIEKRIAKSLELLGGIDRFVSKGDVVFIKPNLVYPAPPPLTTDGEVIGALIKLVKQAGAEKVLVGEGGAPVPKRKDNFSTRDVFEATGVGEVVERNGGEVVCLDEKDCEEIEVASNIIYKKIKVAKSVLNSDRLIGVPVLKTHYDTDVSLGIKGWHGVIADEDKFWKFHRDDIHQKLVDLARAIKPTLTIIDAGTVMEGSGPFAGDTVKTNLVIAGADIVATDAVATTTMGFDPMEVDHIRIAAIQGLGEINLNKIEVVGEKVDEVKRNFKKPQIKISGIYKNVVAIEGGVCRVCRARTRWALDQLNKLGHLQDEHWTVIIGVDPYLPDPEKVEGKIVIVGDCACFFARSFRRLSSEKCIFIEGCPPIPVPKWVPHYYNP